MRIYCSGIGGIGLSAYAAHMRSRGHEVFGSDRSDSALIQDLKLQGIGITLNQDGSGLPDAIDLLVYSEAIPATAPERALATKKGIRQISYFAALGELATGKTVIAVCGTHGKSSTTAMVAKVLIDAGMNPSVVVGTKLRELDGRNWRAGDLDLWVIEACEYRRSFLFLKPTTILITNADGDHFDAYKDLSDYESAFKEFIKKLPSDGVLIAHGGDAQVQSIIKKASRSSIDADTQPMVALGTPGVHMRSNAQLVLALAEQLKIKPTLTKASLKDFRGTWRRMEVKGVTKDGVTVIDDYGHHPVEIKATLAAMREAYPNQRIVCVFQPHTHDRTLKLWDDFSKAFVDAYLVLVTDVYDARPDTTKAVANPSDLSKAIAKNSKVKTQFGGSLDQSYLALKKILTSGDVLVCLGAGDIPKLTEKFMM